MSEAITWKIATNNTIECVLSASDSYIETMSIQDIELQPGLLELVIRTQLLSAKNPAEKQVKSRTCIERTRLIELQQCIDQFLQATGSSSVEPLIGYVDFSDFQGIESKDGDPIDHVSKVSANLSESKE